MDLILLMLMSESHLLMTKAMEERVEKTYIPLEGWQSGRSSADGCLQINERNIKNITVSKCLQNGVHCCIRESEGLTC